MEVWAGVCVRVGACEAADLLAGEAQLREHRGEVGRLHNVLARLDLSTHALEHKRSDAWGANTRGAMCGVPRRGFEGGVPWRVVEGLRVGSHGGSSRDGAAAWVP
jgi:hypothetical protein